MEEQKTLEDLKQKIINDLYGKNYYNSQDIELIKILIDDENKKD